ncbi:MAG: glycosyltransferase family 2 protein [Anaerolineae bacterium]
MRLSVVIVNWNTRNLLERCLNSVSSDLSGFANGSVETWVVDNASTDGSADLVKQRFPWVTLIENSGNVGFARANNQAIRQAAGRFILLLNSDTEIFPGALPGLIDAAGGVSAGRRGRAAGAQPRRLLQNCYGSLPSVASEIIGPYALDFLTKPWGKLGRHTQSRAIDKDGCQVVDRVSFACTMIRREALEQVGLLDERFEFYSEDYDWFLRLRNAGWQTIFCPQAQIIHYWGASSGQRSEWSLRQLYRSKRLYFAKHQGAAAEAVLRLGLTMRFALKWLIGAARRLYDKPAATRQMAVYQRLIQDMLQRITP